MIFFLYQFLIFIIIIISPIILIIRFIKKKEDKSKFIEKFCVLNRNNTKGNLIWFHCASVGELMSVIPLIYELEKNRKIEKILVTTTTLSSSKIFKNFKFKKTIHQFFPIDFCYFTSKFINHWKPKLAIFVDSEIWPGMFREIKKKSIPLILMNARITKKTFKRWSYIKRFSQEVFSNINIAYPQNIETVRYLKFFKVKKLKKIGNLKFTETKDLKIKKFSNSFRSLLKKRLIMCATSTHPSEEVFVGKAHNILKKKFPNLMTIIIPRHIHRVDDIEKDLNDINLKIIKRTSNQKIQKNTDVYIVDTFGETKRFLKVSNLAFMGGSIISHGGQNPIEPARFGLNIIHGPNIDNFNDIYKFFLTRNISYKVTNLENFVRVCENLFNKKNIKKINLKKIGNTILQKSTKEINKMLVYEIEKT